VKILQVVNFFSPVHGGSAEVPYQLAKVLAKRGHEVTVYTSDYKLSEEWIKSVQELRIKVSPFKSWLNLIGVQITPGLIKCDRRETKNFDVIHMHNYRTFQNIIVHHYAKKYGIPYILQAHGSLPVDVPKQTLKKMYDSVWGYSILRDAAKVIAVTPTEAEQYKSMGVSEDKIEIVPNGIDLAEFDNLPPKGEFRRKYGLSGEQKIILYLGRIHQTKGLELLVKAFAEVTKELPNTKLVIVGPDDGYLPALEKLIKELKIENKTLLTGPLYGEDKLKAYVDADVFVNPRADEIFGIVFLEALACGTSVICSRGCGIADVIDGRAGLVVPYDEKQLQQVLLDVLSDEKMRQEFGEKGKLLVREKFNWVKVAERLESVYSSCISSRT